MRLVPGFDGAPHILPVMVASIQSIGAIHGAGFIYRTWASRDGQIVPPSNPVPLRPPVCPWQAANFYNYDTWAVITRIAHQFLSQAQPMPEMEFLNTATDYVAVLGEEQWIIRITVFVMYFLKMAIWSWSVIFHE